MYYRNAKAAIVVYDITDMASFERAKRWVEELRSSGTVDLVIGMAGNKCDLEEERKVPTARAQEYTSANNMVFLETSAKTNKNVTELFSSIAVKLPRGTRQGAGNSMGSGGLPRPRLQQPQRKKGCC